MWRFPGSLAYAPVTNKQEVRVTHILRRLQLACHTHTFGAFRYWWHTASVGGALASCVDHMCDTTTHAGTMQPSHLLWICVWSGAVVTARVKTEPVPPAPRAAAQVGALAPSLPASTAGTSSCGKAACSTGHDEAAEGTVPVPAGCTAVRVKLELDEEGGWVKMVGLVEKSLHVCGVQCCGVVTSWHTLSPSAWPHTRCWPQTPTPAMPRNTCPTSASPCLRCCCTLGIATHLHACASRNTL